MRLYTVAVVSLATTGVLLATATASASVNVNVHVDRRDGHAPETRPPHPSVPKPKPKAHHHVHHHHDHVGRPQRYLDEEALLRSHQPDPLSYWAYDRYWHVSDPRTGALEPNQPEKGEGEGEEEALRESTRYGSWMNVHAVTMILAWFIAFPLAIVFHIARHPLGLVVASSLFTVLMGVSLAMGRVYSAKTPDLYMGSVHAVFGWCVSLLGLAFGIQHLVSSILDIRRRRCDHAFQSTPSTEYHDYAPLTLCRQPEDCERLDTDDDVPLPPHRGTTWHHVPPSNHDAEPRHHHHHHHHVTFMTNSILHHPRGRPQSIDSGSTLSSNGAEAEAKPEFGRVRAFLSSSPTTTRPNPTRSALRLRLPFMTRSWSNQTVAARVWKRVCTIVERGLVPASFAVAISGMVEYTGMCRSDYQHACLAHLIKGGIFVWYGLLTWSRYVGAYAEYGWAWNKKPDLAPAWLPSAEFLESGVIFLYGITNTWMERFGAHKGDPYTVKEVQHISIAVMFWFAGLSGMLLESKAIQSLLSAPITSLPASESTSSIKTPPWYSFSFNPFPALTIGVTGIAMAAHTQEYEFQVTIHALWGLFLALFAFLRLTTYIFLYLGPPTTSILPSRPPTEALASVCLISGGIVFILSMEQVTFAAMRHGFDDIMACLNATIALVCFLCTWILVLFSIKGWATRQPINTE